MSRLSPEQKVAIKQTSRPGQDTKLFRAYGLSEMPGRRDEPLGITASTTSNPEFGAKRCAAKAFVFLQGFRLPAVAREQSAVLDRISEPLTEVCAGGWIAELAPCYEIALLGLQKI